MSIALELNNEGKFSLVFENGVLKQEDPDLSRAKHNLLCFARADRNRTVNPTLRKGSLGDYLEGRKLYSAAWVYYLEGTIDEDSLRGIKYEFNKSCDRDLQAGLLTKKVQLISVMKLSKTSVLCKLRIGDNQVEIPV